MTLSDPLVLNIHVCLGTRSEIFEPLNLEVAREEGAGPPFGPSFAADLVELLKDFKEKEVADKQSNEVNAAL